MGAYLSTPITDKETLQGSTQCLSYGGSAMQGWRQTMEDAHLAVTGLTGEDDFSMFGVFDGHGGAEVAKFCQRYLPQEIQKLKSFEDGSIEVSLVHVFHKMDDMLRDFRYAEEIEQLKTKHSAEDEDKDGGDDNEGVSQMDTIEIFKRMFQLKRFSGENGNAGGEPSDVTAEDLDPQLGGDARVQAGCTAVVAIKRGSELYVGNAGDSRGVLCRGGRAVALSEDHKPASDTEKNRIIAAGGFLSDIGGVCRVNGNLNLSRAIGDLKYKSNSELQAKDQIITAEPDVHRITLQPEDSFFVLACDGVWDVMTNQEAIDFIRERLERNMTPTEVSSHLLDACLAEDPKEARGIGCDNMTAIIVQLLAQP